MKIYTKKGDEGMTSLVGGQRVKKSCTRLESYGTIDELCSHIGLLVTYCTTDSDREELTEVQRALFVIGGYLATDNSQREVRATHIITDEAIATLEQRIDKMESSLPPFRCFILPGGSRAAAQCHVCRTVCRRAERIILRLKEEGTEVDAHVTSYINRLSDYLFVLARKLNADAGTQEVVWSKN